MTRHCRESMEPAPFRARASVVEFSDPTGDNLPLRRWRPAPLAGKQKATGVVLSQRVGLNELPSLTTWILARNATGRTLKTVSPSISA